MGSTLWGKCFITAAVALTVCLGGSNLKSKDGSCPYLASQSASVVLGGRTAMDAMVKPEAVYHRVWSLIKDDYYLPDYNGQNWAKWEHRYDGKLKTLDDAHKGIETMLASLGDRYTRFLDRDAFDDEKSQIESKLCGIGVQIGVDKNHRIVVIAPIEGTPAARAGIMPADEIAEINGHSTKGFSVEDAAKQIRGTIKTDVSLIIRRGQQKLKMRITRDEIPIKAVQTAKMLDSDVGYIRLSSFISQQANQEMKEALEKLKKAKGIVLDLRDNPGGLLSNAIDISNLFLDRGENIVSTVDRDGYKTPQPAEYDPISKQPLIVLVNKGSASASEITSGALRDQHRATLVGQTTFGKGLVQGINRLEDGSGVNITIAKYVTPMDTDINKKGITPNHVVDLSDKDYHDGFGPWWMDPDGPRAKREPEDMKDKQLKAAVDDMHKEIGSTPSVAIGRN